MSLRAVSEVHSLSSLAKHRAAMSKRIRPIVTPEGVPLEFAVADAGDRATGFVIDQIYLFAMKAVLGLLLFALTPLIGGLAMALSILTVFLLDTFYFVWFELRWQGQTPGKKRAKIRVIDRSGGVLGAPAVFARNLTRQLEVMLPLGVLFAPDSFWPGAPSWVRLTAGVWAFVFAFLPLFNRDRLRVGDLIAGTIVIAKPTAVLFGDLGSLAARPSHARKTRYTFSAEQLSYYGIFELQVLEDVLRKAHVSDPTGQTAVCNTIMRKIGWPVADWTVDETQFLRDFYTAQRAHLEGRMLFGDRRESKFDRSGKKD